MNNMHYINFCFENLTYDDDYYTGSFRASDYDVYCDFEYNRKTGDCTVSNSSKSPEEILPLPVRWLDRKLEEKGFLKEKECRTCF